MAIKWNKKFSICINNVLETREMYPYTSQSQLKHSISLKGGQKGLYFSTSHTECYSPMLHVAKEAKATAAETAAVKP